MGRYTKDRHQRNKKHLAIIEKTKLIVPYLLNFSDSQDIIVICNQSFGDLVIKDWNLEIENFRELFHQATNAVSQGIYTKAEYMDTLEITGIEIDRRGLYTRFIEAIMNVSYKKALKIIRKIPGLDKLSHREFTEVILSNKTDITILLAVTSKTDFTSEGIVFKVDDKESFTFPTEYLNNLGDEPILEMQRECGIRLAKANIKFEEAMFLTVINMLCTIKTSRQFRDIYDRFVLAFSRYLEETYGKQYHLRLQELISVVTYFKEENIHEKAWLKQNQTYLKAIYKTPLMRAFMATPEIDKGIELLANLEI
ncbi:unnamed protein product [Dimorphilus gyrociliatus]|uniref:Uncharacterized protein n=1 Tax=Dimorphilus gyrociliatus TaxID=2664684 RepID=A0A7I8VRM8_9ANNE|nr:unnamed protein product [Dimorphilus gyrociliatus]